MICVGGLLQIDLWQGSPGVNHSLAATVSCKILKRHALDASQQSSNSRARAAISCIDASSWTELATRYDSYCSLGLFVCCSTTAMAMAHESAKTSVHIKELSSASAFTASPNIGRYHMKSPLALNSFPPLRHIRYIRNAFTHSAVQTLSKLWDLKFLR